MKRKMILIALTIIICGSINAQVLGNWRYNGIRQQTRQAQQAQIAQAKIQNNSEFNFQAKALMNVTAFSYVATFNVTQVGKDLKDVVEKSEFRIRQFISDLQMQGIDTNDINVDMISMVPVYDYTIEKRLFSKTYNEIPDGFELQKNILIKYKSSSNLDNIVKSAVLNEIYDLVKVDYFIENIEDIKDSLRKKTIAYLQKKLKDLSSLGINFDTLYKVFSEDYQTILPTEKYESYTAFSRPSFDNAIGRKAIVSDGKMNRIKKPKTMFYNPVSYTDFDIVVNPEILEPVVQFTYSVNIKYIIKEKKEIPKNTYMILTPDGKIQQIQIN